MKQATLGTPSSAGPSSPRASRLIGTTISGRYRLEAVVSESVTGTLYRGEHTHMHKRIAVKLLHPEAASRPAVLARFEREAIAGAHVDHPNVALAKDFGTLDDGSRFLVMEYLDGITLREALKNGALPVERALHIARQIAYALDAAHAIGIVHRALMPENVHLIERGGERDVVKLVDFGSAMLPQALVPTRSDRDSVAERVTTPFDPVPAMAAYAAPELIAAKDVDGRADLYSLGIVAWEMLTGNRPTLARGESPPSLRPHRTVPAAIDALLRQLLAEVPEQRLGRASDVASVFESVLSSAAAGRRASQTSLPSLEGAAAESAALGATVLSAGQRAALRAGRTSLPSGGAVGEFARRAATSLGAKAPSWYVGLPRPIRIGVGGALGIIVIVVVAITLRSPATEDALVALAGTSSQASPGSSQPGGARTAPPHSDDKFSDPDPSAGDDRSSQDGRALADRFVREVSSRRLNDSVTTLEYIAKVDPKVLEDRDIREMLVKLSQRVTQVNGPAPDRYFDVLASQLGSFGPDVLFELMTTKGGSDAAERAARMLKDEAVRDRGTPALRIAYDLRSARSCEDRVAMLERVKKDGDRRTLGPLLQMNECGRRGGGDCCLRDDPRLKSAMQALKERGVRWQ